MIMENPGFGSMAGSCDLQLNLAGRQARRVGRIILAGSLRNRQFSMDSNSKHIIFMHVPGSGNGSIGCGSKFYAVLPHSWALLKGGTRAGVRSGRQVGSTCSASQAEGVAGPGQGR